MLRIFPGTEFALPELSYQASSAELGDYLAVPTRPGPWPGVVVIMDALGLGRHQDQADLLAAAGYLAFAPDLYSGRGIRCVLATIQASRSGRGEAYEDIEAARRGSTPGRTARAKVGIIGFCMGGGFALLSAPRYDFAGGVGQLRRGARRTPLERLRGACPIVASYGAATAACGAGRRGWSGADRARAWPTTSRSTRTPATASSTGSTPGRCSAARAGGRLQLPPAVSRGRLAADPALLRQTHLGIDGRGLRVAGTRSALEVEGQGHECAARTREVVAERSTRA